MSICIIFNPAARGEKAKKLQKSLESSPGRFALKPTHCAGAARALAANAVREGFSTIIAAGGDGTLNEVLNGIGDVPEGLARTRLGVLPLGTINVFAREMRIPLDPGKVWPVLEAGHETILDIASAEYDGQKRLFIQLAGAGLDARSVELVNWELKKKFGPLAYLAAGLQALGAPQSRITVSNGVETLTGELVLIGNGRLYGGNYPFFHKGDLQDGLLDAVVVERMTWSTLPGLGVNFALGRLFKEGQTGYLQGTDFTLRADVRTAFQVDGEAAGTLPARISVRPRCLRVIIPKPVEKFLR